jgi:aerobic C4-dicarboxylate transport protein
VLPAGYTFNPDGTAVYLTIATLFVAQAMNIDLSLSEQLVIFGVLMLTSKGSAGVVGGGFVTLAATPAVCTRSRLPAWCSCSGSTAS